jgi:putative NADH-flavin reductase
MHLSIFGATGPTGQYLLQEGLRRGYSITALVRNPMALQLAHEQLHVIQGDIADMSAVEEAIRGTEAVLSVLGAAYSFKPINVYSVGTAHMLAAMRKTGVRRILCTSSGAANPAYEPREGLFFGLLFKHTYGRTLYVDMRRMEQEVAKTELDWTIVRPAQLIETAGVTPYRVGPGYFLPNGTKTSRRDLADFMLREVVAHQYVRQQVAIATDVPTTR